MGNGWEVGMGVGALPFPSFPLSPFPPLFHFPFPQLSFSLSPSLVDIEVAEESMRLAACKLPMATRFVARLTA